MMRKKCSCEMKKMATDAVLSIMLAVCGNTLAGLSSMVIMMGVVFLLSHERADDTCSEN